MNPRPAPTGAPFEKLRVWHDAVDLTVLVYRHTAAWPPSERYGITAQVRRSSISVVANLAEGSARLGKKAFHAFSQIAFGSLKEVEALLHIAVVLGYSRDEELVELRAHLARTSRQLLRMIQRIGDG